MKTFEEVIEQEGASAIYSGTNVNAATQAILFDWFADLYICTGDNIPKFIRYYRRQLNVLYPIYLDYLKLELVRDDMDPFITEYITRTHEDEKTSSGTNTKSGTSTIADSGTITDVLDSETVRTPDLTTSGTNSNQETRNLAGSSETDSTHNEEGQADGKQRTVNIAYPEANLNSLPIDIDNMPTNINYASSEQDQFSRQNTEGETTDHSETDTTDTGTVNNAGTNSQHEGGTDTSETDQTNTRTLATSRQGSDSETSTNSGTEANEGEEHEEGRHESEADILPRAISAITSTKAVYWFVKSMQLCFDNYSEI